MSNNYKEYEEIRIDSISTTDRVLYISNIIFYEIYNDIYAK